VNDCSTLIAFGSAAYKSLSAQRDATGGEDKQGQTKMMDKLGRIGLLIVATLGIWMAVAMMDAVTGSSGMTNFAAIIAFLSTIALWLVWGLSNLETRQQAAKGKAKRKPAEDARLALLLELMDEDDRQALKQRLMDEIGGDGEAISMADLLQTEEKRSGQHRTG
jgi:hypothetical protein